MQVADAQFGFLTARSGSDPSHEARLKAIEASVDRLSKLFSAAVGEPPPSTLKAKPKGGPKVKSKAAVQPPGSVPGAKNYRSRSAWPRPFRRAGPVLSPRIESSQDGAGVVQTSPVEGALVALTKIVGELSRGRRRPRSGLYGTIERLMEEDLLQRQLDAGLGNARATARGWLEHRSNVSLCPTTVRLLWSLCGAWDCLRND